MNGMQWGSAPEPDEAATIRQDEVHSLHTALKNTAAGKFNAPVFLKECIKREVWKHQRIFPGGGKQEPISFREFVQAPFPVGLGTDFASLYDHAGDDQELAELLSHASGGNAGVGGASAHPIRHFRISDIEVGARLRELNEEEVGKIAESISKIGLQIPLSVMSENGRNATLVSGHHRLEACRTLGMAWVPCAVHANEREARLWEISENLHRAELTVLERAEHIAEWIRLTEEKQSPAQIEPVKSRREDGRGGSLGQGINAAVRELGLERNEAQRAMRIAGIDPEAKEAAKQARLADHQSDLLKIAREPKSRQLEAVHDVERQRANREADRAIAEMEAENFAEWLVNHTDPSEVSQIISWIQACKPKSLISAIRRRVMA